MIGTILEHKRFRPSPKVGFFSCSLYWNEERFQSSYVSRVTQDDHIRSLRTFSISSLTLVKNSRTTEVLLRLRFPFRDSHRLSKVSNTSLVRDWTSRWVWVLKKKRRNILIYSTYLWQKKKVVEGKGSPVKTWGPTVCKPLQTSVWSNSVEPFPTTNCRSCISSPYDELWHVMSPDGGKGVVS